MDLIYTDASMKDLGSLQDFKMDLAFGIDENNFELSVSNTNHVCESGSVVYIEGTEYGGIVEGIRVETSGKKIIYMGSTWHGLLESKIIEPDAGEDYLVVSGDANVVLAALIERMGLSELFAAKNEPSGLEIRNYAMNRYIEGYSGIKKMLATVNGKLKMTYQEGKVILYAERLVDYSQDDEFDSDQSNLLFGVIATEFFYGIFNRIALGIFLEIVVNIINLIIVDIHLNIVVEVEFCTRVYDYFDFAQQFVCRQ